ncbi:polysaccharide pyruvyl transferase [Nocardioides albertanoniae]|uniref:Polysaccharide pyruvyl transferase n=1 Tax=Nocardioides albertanoniae TaxID=1175486 RepID=A0A543A1Y2_9ACTN|nr:polysaccharide pyruvyl transferase [Nocardioides albertanoniae]
MSPLRLSEAWPVHREPPRPPELRQSDYLDKFDHDTLVYDAFPVTGPAGDTVRLIGPPLLNLATSMAESVWRLDGMEATAHLHDLNRTQGSWLSATAVGGETLSVTSGEASCSAVVSESGVDWFRDRSVLVTKSKDNDLRWITDWARFHAATQGVDAVLLYDNGSGDYRPEDVLAALDVPGIEVAVVVSWPFKFGPQGGNWEGLSDAPWDSDFCEYGILEHARHRFLSAAAGVLNHDIDELAISEDDAGAFDLLAASDSGAIRYRGRWIDTPRATTTQPPRFTDFTVYDSTQPPTTHKWAIDPRRTPDAVQWKTHSVRGVSMTSTDRIRHRHFTGITSNWKYARAADRAVLSSIHRNDDRLRDALAGVFGAGSIHPVAGVHVVDREAAHSNRQPTAIAGYWPGERTDFGDQLGPWLLGEMTGRPSYNTIGHPDDGDALMTIGSLVTDMERPGMTIWGSGLRAPLRGAALERLRDRKPREIRAVRGVRTRNQLIKHLGWDVPEVFGDPALLMPYVLRPGERPSGRSGLSVVVDQSHTDIVTESLIARAGGHRVDVQRPTEEVVEEIAQSEVVVSTSLHGLIIAQAYGIPWVWLRIDGTGVVGYRFRFSDFFTTLEKSEVVSVATTVETAPSLDLAQVASSASLPGSKFDPRALVDALPYDLRDDFLRRLPRPRRSWVRWLSGP